MLIESRFSWFPSKCVKAQLLRIFRQCGTAVLLSDGRKHTEAMNRRTSCSKALGFSIPPNELSLKFQPSSPPTPPLSWPYRASLPTPCARSAVDIFVHNVPSKEKWETPMIRNIQAETHECKLLKAKELFPRINILQDTHPKRRKRSI